MSFKIIFFPVLTLLVLASCKTDENSITGNWSVNIGATIRNAQSIGASQADIQEVKNTYQDGKLQIKDSEIKVFITGVSGEINYSYTVTGHEGDCSILKVNGQPGSYKYCIKNGQLVVRDPSTPLIAVYDKQ